MTAVSVHQPDLSGFASVRRNLDLIDEVSPFWYALDPHHRLTRGGRKAA